VGRVRDFISIWTNEVGLLRRRIRGTLDWSSFYKTSHSAEERRMSQPFAAICDLSDACVVTSFPCCEFG